MTDIHNMMQLSHVELKDYVSFCNENNVSPNVKSFADWQLAVNKNRSIISTAKWLVTNNLFSDVETLLRCYINIVDELKALYDNRDFGLGSYSEELVKADSWLNEYMRK